MIRRKIWASATVCLALASAAQAQTGAVPSGTSGLIPAPSAPAFVPRTYMAPLRPGYAAPQAPTAAMPPVVAAPAAGPSELFAVGEATTGTAIPTAPPAPAPMNPMPPTIGPAPSVIEQPMPMGGTMMPMPAPIAQPLNGGPIIEQPTGLAPFLEGIGGYNLDGSMPSCWISGEVVRWRIRGMDTPALITAAPVGSPGTLGDVNTTVVYGGEDLLQHWHTGVRLRAGFWFPNTSTGIDIGVFGLGRVHEQVQYSSTGDPGLFRPFFNTAIGAQDAQLIAFTDPVAGPLLSGQVRVNSLTDLYGGEANLRQGWGMGLGGRVDALVGYRYLRLRDTMSIESSSVTQTAAGAAPAGTRIFSNDHIEALNQFHGGQVGLAGEWQLGQLTVGFRGTMAVGFNQQSVELTGQSGSVTPAGTSIGAPSALFALPFNSGEHSHTRFALAPEVGVNVGYQVTNNIRVFGGYNLLYWTHVARAGEQIRQNINGTFIADPTTGTATPAGAPAPVFKMHDDYFYAHGCTAGVEFRW